jgi:cell shape-determining protein MreC
VFSNLSRRRILLLVVITCLLLITLDRRGNIVIDKLRTGFDRITRPVDTATETLVLPLERAWYGMTNYEDLEAENARLRDEIASMKGAEIEALTAVLQYRELLQQTQLVSKYSYDYVIGEVVGESPSNYQQVVEINVGSARGIEVGMPVVDGTGLVGKVTRVLGPNKSLVMLMTDPDYAISARVYGGDDTGLDDTGDGTSTATSAPGGADDSGIVTGTIAPGSDDGLGGAAPSTAETTTTLPLVVRETGLIEGQGPDRAMLLRFTDLTTAITDIKVGAIVDTAGGTDSIAPQSIAIGRVTAVIEQTGTASALVEVTPFADLRRLSFLTVLLYKPNEQAVQV